MTPEQRSRYRRLAEVELERGNVMAAVVLDCLDELDVLVPPETAAPVLGGPRATASIKDVTPLRDRALRDLLANQPSARPPTPAPTVVPLHDLDFGPGGEIETDLGGEPSLDGRAPMRDAPPTTQS